MKRIFIRICSTLVSFLTCLLISDPTLALEKTEDLDKLFTYYSDNARFSGIVLAAENGRVIYEKAFGFSGYEEKKMMDTSCVFNIASATKPFTAVAIMMLKERGLLSYDDKMVKFLPGFPSYAKNITIRHLLTHTSGLADYVNEMHLDQSFPELTSSLVYDSLVVLPALNFTPGSQYLYCNSGYFLLALIIEKVTGRSYREFLESNIFVPLGMDHTYAYDESVSGIPLRVNSYIGFWHLNEDDLAYKLPGDGNIYTSASDLFLFDQALYSNKLVKQETMSEAIDTSNLFTINKNGVKYGFGWYILMDKGDTYVYHPGGLGGFRCQFWRDIGNRNTLIVLANSISLQSNTGILAGAQSIMKGEPYTLDNISITELFYKVYYSQGFELSIKEMKRERGKVKTIYTFPERELNNLGMDFLFVHNEPLHAMEIFKFNTELFPGSWNAFDSLGEIYLKIGEDDLVMDAFKRSLELNPENSNAAGRLKALSKAKKDVGPV